MDNIFYPPKERDSGRSRGFAFVRFFDKHDAEVRIEAKENEIKTFWREVEENSPQIFQGSLFFVIMEIIETPEIVTAKQFIPSLGNWLF